MLKADSALCSVPGVGPRRAAALEKLGVGTVEDLLYVLPFRYEDRRAFARIGELRPGGREMTLAVHVESSRLIRTRRRGFTIFEARLKDESGSIRAVWYNQPYLQRVFPAGRRAVVFGRASVDRYGTNLVLENPDHEIQDDQDAEGIHTGRIVPVYRKLGEWTSRMQRTLVFRVLEGLAAASVPEPVPHEIGSRHGFLPRLEALRQTHFPPAHAGLDALAERRTLGQRSLAFEEIFLLQIGLALRRVGFHEEARGISYAVPDALRTRLARVLPFRLTQAQKRVLREIREDLESPHPMGRLLQGDVGSGKTIVALLAMLVAVENGYQAALMVPTEILAEQHFRSLSQLLRREGTDYRPVLLSGSLRSARRKEVLEEIGSGRAQIVLGTHALFEPQVRFHRLGLVVVDEQHRFGVLQRAALAGKGERPDVLVMTATPIPRSLALTVYGDLELSVIDELPPGRTPIRTVVRGEAERKRVYEGVRTAISRGQQAYVVVPLVEETEKTDLKAATAFAGKLQAEVFPDRNVGLVHGRLRGEEKDEVMRAFADGRIHVLVATTVIEVGVDVANATVMVVEHAERFGLSQLHQLRGRVGRGSTRSYCVLMVGEDGVGRDARERLRIMEETSDGFRIAEKDLELRGPGAVFGTQQHGLSDLQFLALVLKDPALLDAARAEAHDLVHGGPGGQARARRILGSLRGAWRRRIRLAEVG